jgi:hypothetical protein
MATKRSNSGAGMDCQLEIAGADEIRTASSPVKRVHDSWDDVMRERDDATSRLGSLREDNDR